MCGAGVQAGLQQLPAGVIGQLIFKHLALQDAASLAISCKVCRQAHGHCAERWAAERAMKQAKTAPSRLWICRDRGDGAQTAVYDFNVGLHSLVELECMRAGHFVSGWQALWRHAATRAACRSAGCCPDIVGFAWPEPFGPEAQSLDGAALLQVSAVKLVRQAINEHCHPSTAAAIAVDRRRSSFSLRPQKALNIKRGVRLPGLQGTYALISVTESWQCMACMPAPRS